MLRAQCADCRFHGVTILAAQKIKKTFPNEFFPGLAEKSAILFIGIYKDAAGQKPAHVRGQILHKAFVYAFTLHQGGLRTPRQRLLHFFVLS